MSGLTALTPDGVGSVRDSASVSLMPVKLKNQSFPKIGQIAFEEVLVVRIERGAALADGRPSVSRQLVRRRHDAPAVGHLLVAVGCAISGVP